MLHQFPNTINDNGNIFLPNTLGMISISEREGLSDDILAHQNKCVEELKRINVDTLKPLAKYYRHAISDQKKQELIDAIKSGPQNRV